MYLKMDHSYGWVELKEDVALKFRGIPLEIDLDLQEEFEIVPEGRSLALYKGKTTADFFEI